MWTVLLFAFVTPGAFAQGTSLRSFTSAAEVLPNPPVGAGGWDAAAYERELGDVNGDGRDDIVFFGNDGITVALANASGNGFDLEPVWPRFGSDSSAGLWGTQTRRMLADVNGDGRDDIVGFHNTGVFLALREGAGYSYKSLALADKFCPKVGWDFAVHPVVLDDVNGDGKADIIGFWNDGVHLSLARNDGSGWNAPSQVLSPTFNQTYQTPDYLRGLTGDVNGDGKADLIGFGWGGTVVALANANGDGFDLQSTFPHMGRAHGWFAAKHPRIVADVDGDGRDDIVGFANSVVCVAFSQGNGGFRWVDNAYTKNFCHDKGQWRVGEHPRILADVDGDGRDDIVGFAGTKTLFALAKHDGTGFEDERTAEDAYGANWQGGNRLRVLADLDGNGLKDIVGFGTSHVYQSLATGWDMQATSEFGRWQTKHAPRLLLHLGYALAVFAGKPSSSGAEGVYYSVRESDGKWLPARALNFPTGSAVDAPRLLENLGPGADGTHAKLIGTPVNLAITPVDSPLRVRSDGRHVYLFRQGTDGFLYADRFVFDQATSTLNRTREVRYRKSGKKFEPQDAWDSLGAADMNGNAFYEPTIRLQDVRNIAEGRFDVLLTPTAIAGEEYWKLFAYESGSSSLDIHSIRRGTDGWFDFRDRTVTVGLDAQGSSSATLLVGYDRTRLAPSALGSSSFRGAPVAIEYKDQISDGGSGAIFAGVHVLLAAPTDSGIQLVDLPLLQNGTFAVLDAPLPRNAVVTSALPAATLDRFPGLAPTPQAWTLDTDLPAGPVTLLESADGRVHLRYHAGAAQPELLYDALRNHWTASTPSLPIGMFLQHSVLEIGTMVFSGVLATGSMDRLYAFLDAGGSLAVLARKGVAELESTYLGQNQIGRTLVGYIEGAPPVPKENLTIQPSYEGAAQVSLVTTESTEQAWSREMEAGRDFNMFAASFLAYSIETSRGWLSGDSVSTQQAITTVNPVKLTGVTAGSDPSCPAGNNQWCPRNIGVAVLESSFADIYALRKRGETALYSYYMRPGGTGPSKEVVTFQINPHYTKQGVLDGWNGTTPDPDFGLSAGQVASYRRDAETQEWIEQIEVKRETLQAHYEQSVSDPLQMQNKQDWTSAEVAAWSDNTDKASQRSFMNEYSWDAASGSLNTTEVQRVMSTGSTVGGSYDFKAQGGVHIVASAGAGISFEVWALDVMIGGHVNRTFQSSERQTDALTITVEENGLERNGILDLNGAPLTAGERVDHYSWKTFHLEEAQEHFEDFFDHVVDPVWLTGNSSAAKALRTARQNSISNPVWRVVHRVDFVSRPYAQIPGGAPEVPGAAAAGAPAAPDASPAPGAGELSGRMSAGAITAQRAAGIHSPWQLVRRVDPAIVAAAESRKDLRVGIQQALDTLEPQPDVAVRRELEGYLLNHFERRR